MRGIRSAFLWACAALLVSACNVDYGGNTTSQSSGGSNLPPAPSDAVHTVALPAVTADARIARVVVRRYTGTEVPIRDPVTGALIGFDLQNKSEVFRYIQDLDLASGLDTLPIPDGNYYTLEVIAAGPVVSGTSRTILEYYKTNIFNVPTTTTPIVFTQPDVVPRFTYPTIYAGLGPPYDSYVLTVQNFGYPLSTSKWTMRCTSYGATGSTNGVVSYSGVKFAAPPAGTTGTVTYEAAFGLDPSLFQPTSVIANDPAKTWTWTITYPNATTIASSTDVVVLPP